MPLKITGLGEERVESVADTNTKQQKLDVALWFGRIQRGIWNRAITLPALGVFPDYAKTKGKEVETHWHLSAHRLNWQEKGCDGSQKANHSVHIHCAVERSIQQDLKLTDTPSASKILGKAYCTNSESKR